METIARKISGMICKNSIRVSPSARGTKSVAIRYQWKNTGFSATRIPLARYGPRDKGAMNCIISRETTDHEVLKRQSCKVPKMEVWFVVESCSQPYFLETKRRIGVAVVDFGAKLNILRGSLAERVAVI